MNERLPEQLSRMRRERDLFSRLLQLGGRKDIGEFLAEALGLIVDVSGAEHGYLELRDPLDTGSSTPWSIAHGFSASEIQAVRTRISSGIIAHALATGQTVDTPSALLDPRFAQRGSVRSARIQAVLCVPIGQDPPLGALYLQGREREGPFDADDRERAELIARHLGPLVDNLIVRSRARGAEDPTLAFRGSLRAEGVIGCSPALARLLREVSLVAPLDVNVLLTGESGTGKSQIARVIHDSGSRSGMPFVELNCATLPESLVESELFGALAGSHSTADRRRPGKVEAADKGTLFLDEVGELAAGAQSKLLQLLQSHTYYPLGATEPSRADLRVIAASNADLETAVERGTFRAVLLYRLQVLPLRVPSLDERRSDLPELARHFVDLACQRHGLRRLELSSGALRALESAPWPGNLRQLAHALEAAAIRASGMSLAAIERVHVFPDAQPQAAAPEGDETFQQATQRFQRQLLSRALESAGWNVSETARRLDLARSHVYTLIKGFGLERDPE